jgi:class 3 adenylate cyclase
MRHVAELLPDSRYEVIKRTDSLPAFVDRYVREVSRFVLGDAQAAERRRALTTLLFTDIVGSTERAAAIGDAAWRELLAAQRAILLREIDAADGTLLDQIGDGSMSTFPGPAQAIRCAERLSAAVRDELGVQTRAGVHTGDCELLDGGVAGITVHIAARVSAQANAGQVIVSQTVHDLITGSGIELHSIGQHDLKGVPGTWELFAVGSHSPLPAPHQDRNLRPIDHVTLLAARRAPSLVRTLTRLASAASRPR